MMCLLYRFFNGRHVERLFNQHSFELLASSPENLRRARAHCFRERTALLKP